MRLNFRTDIWHSSETFYIAKIGNYFINFKTPVKSDTLHAPRQKRFRIDYKGNILDFERMSEEQIKSYFNDKEEQARQNAAGLRHRNEGTIRCRYSYIESNEKMMESLERIRKKKKENRRSFESNHYTAYRVPSNSNCESANNYLNNNNFQPNPEEILIVYVHGGGLFTSGSTTCECYLRTIVDNLAGIPILSIDYSLTVPFPIPVQEVLDVYLWTLSRGKDVKEALGFNPKKIVLSGDSCGSLYGLSAIIAINELNRKLTDKIPLPSAIVWAYPCVSISNLVPSEGLIVFESLIGLQAILIMISIYAANLSTNGDFKKIENCKVVFFTFYFKFNFSLFHSLQKVNYFKKSLLKIKTQLN